MEPRRRSFHDDWSVDWQNPLGEGSYGSVYVATSKVTPGKRVALKVFSTDEEGYRAQQKEVAAYLAVKDACKSSGMVCLEGHGREYLDPFAKSAIANPFVLMTLVENARDGSAYLTRRGFADLKQATWTQFFGAMVSGARQLSKFHELGWVLRDVKPANMMISWPEQKCVFIDMNFACPLSQCQAWTGTNPYLHPQAMAIRDRPPDKKTLESFNRSPSAAALRRANDVWAFALSFADLFCFKAFGVTFENLFPRAFLPAEQKYRQGLSGEMEAISRGRFDRFERAFARLNELCWQKGLTRQSDATKAKDAIEGMLRFEPGRPNLQIEALQRLAATPLPPIQPAPHKRTTLERGTSSPPRASPSKRPLPTKASPRRFVLGTPTDYEVDEEGGLVSKAPTKGSAPQPMFSPDHFFTPKLGDEDEISASANVRSSSPTRKSRGEIDIPTPRIEFSPGHIFTPKLGGDEQDDWNFSESSQPKKKRRSPLDIRTPRAESPVKRAKVKRALPSSPKRAKTPPGPKKTFSPKSPGRKSIARRSASPPTERSKTPKAKSPPLLKSVLRKQSGRSKASPNKNATSEKRADSPKRTNRQRTSPTLEGCAKRPNRLCKSTKAEMIQDLVNNAVSGVPESRLKRMNRPELWALYQRYFATQ